MSDDDEKSLEELCRPLSGKATSRNHNQSWSSISTHGSRSADRDPNHSARLSVAGKVKRLRRLTSAADKSKVKLSAQGDHNDPPDDDH